MKITLAKTLSETTQQSVKVFPDYCALLGVVINTVKLKICDISLCLRADFILLMLLDYIRWLSS